MTNVGSAGGFNRLKEKGLRDGGVGVKLRREIDILSSWNNPNEKPIVSICCISYNHERFIEDALHGFLMQETEFSFEIVIVDDASTDHTQNIIRNYEKRYPKIIRAIYQEENQYSKGLEPANFYIQHLRGKYVAHCEGDDYWTDRFKLKKQVGFLEKNPDYVACYHNVRVVDKEKRELSISLNNYPYKDEHTVPFQDVEQLVIPGQTASLLYRNHWLVDECVEQYLTCKTNGDVKLAAMLGVKGKIFFMSDVMADHRRVLWEGDSWSARTYGQNLSLHRYNTVESVNDFIFNAYGVKLNNSDKRYRIVLRAICYFLKDPNIDNWNIARDLVGKIKGEIINATLYFVVYPFKWICRKVLRSLGEGDYE